MSKIWLIYCTILHENLQNRKLRISYQLTHHLLCMLYVCMFVLALVCVHTCFMLIKQYTKIYIGKLEHNLERAFASMW